MVADEYSLVKVAVRGYEPGQLQVEVHAEGYRVPASQFLQAVDFTELAAPIGTPDVELNVFMTDDGLQFEWVNTADGQRSRWTSTLGGCVREGNKRPAALMCARLLGSPTAGSAR
jgi:hypothetical protein